VRFFVSLQDEARVLWRQTSVDSGIQFSRV
jgi:hypothetical protein